MELNYECFRKVLLVLEKELHITADSYLEFEYPLLSLREIIDNEELKAFLPADVFYTIVNLEEAGYITAETQFASGVLNECLVTNITYAGHMFLKSVKDNTVWKATMGKVAKVGSVAIPVLLEIAKEVMIKMLIPSP